MVKRKSRVGKNWDGGEGNAHTEARDIGLFSYPFIFPWPDNFIFTSPEPRYTQVCKQKISTELESVMGNTQEKRGGGEGEEMKHESSARVTASLMTRALRVSALQNFPVDENLFVVAVRTTTVIPSSMA